MKYQDYYKTLGVNRDATPEEIKRVYRKLARKYHPDVSDEPQAEARFKEVGEAYEVLKDSEKRAAYDNLGSNWRAGQEFTPPPGWSPGAGFETAFSGGAFDFSDFFGELFGGAGPRAGRVHRSASFTSRGRDERVRVRISLEDAYLGAERDLQPRREGISASPIVVGGKLFVTNDDGLTFVIRTGAEFELLHINDIGARTLASPALVDDTWYFRTSTELIAIGN